MIFILFAYCLCRSFFNLINSSNLEIFGFITKTEIHGEHIVAKILNYEYTHGVWIGEPCNGIKIFGLFSQLDFVDKDQEISQCFQFQVSDSLKDTIKKLLIKL